MHRARELDIDAGDTAALLALDLIARLAVNGRAPLKVVLDTIAAAAPAREALLRARQEAQRAAGAAQRRQAGAARPGRLPAELTGFR